MARKKIGVLTGGGDCPGLNAAVRAVVCRAKSMDYQVMGVRSGWKGLLKKDLFELDVPSVEDILWDGGTMLGTSRTNPYKKVEDAELARKNFKELGFDALISIGGEDTQGVAAKLSKDGFPVIGIPKTIDADLFGTEATIGFDTALGIATECIDRLHTTARSHNRVLVAEVMGRHAGWLTLRSGLAGGAHVIAIPEFETTGALIADILRRRKERGGNYAIVAVAEGAKIDMGEGASDEVLKHQKTDAFGHVALGGIGGRLADFIEKQTGFETRAVVFGHIQRGGTPSAFDRWLATNFGVRAVELIEAGKAGRLVSYTGGGFTDVDIENVLGKLRLVPEEEYRVAQSFFG
ncbi:6-phosphofructokinase [bacterium]|nr:6-phosphofructokinase [bacterium]